MIPYPFGSPAPDQLASIDHGRELLSAFLTRFPEPAPWAINPLGPTVFYPSTSILAVRDAFGREGWTTTPHLIWKEIDGVRVECRLPIQTRPFAWEGVQG